MRQLLSVFIWFVCLASTVKILLPSQPLSYFWFVIIFLSIFFGLSNRGNQEAPEDFNHQQNMWWNKYHSHPYYLKQQYLSEIVNRAIKIGQVEQIEKFLKSIINSEPDNETAQSLLFGIWGTEVLDKDKWKSGNISERVKKWNGGTVNH